MRKVLYRVSGVCGMRGRRRLGGAWRRISGGEFLVLVQRVQQLVEVVVGFLGAS